MKKNNRILLLIFILCLSLGIHSQSHAQSLPPPPPAQHGSSGSQAPGGAGGAPVGDGIYLLIALAGLYGVKKVYNARITLTAKAN